MAATMRPGRYAPTAVVRSGAWWRSRVGQPLDSCRTGHPWGVGSREGGRRHHHGQTFPRNRCAVLGKEAAEGALVGVDGRTRLRVCRFDVNLDLDSARRVPLGVDVEDR